MVEVELRAHGPQDTEESGGKGKWHTTSPASSHFISVQEVNPNYI